MSIPRMDKFPNFPTKLHHTKKKHTFHLHQTNKKTMPSLFAWLCCLPTYPTTLRFLSGAALDPDAILSWGSYDDENNDYYYYPTHTSDSDSCSTTTTTTTTSAQYASTRAPSLSYASSEESSQSGTESSGWRYTWAWEDSGSSEGGSGEGGTQYGSI